MQKLQMELVERIFEALDHTFHDRFSIWTSDLERNIVKHIWSSGLAGLKPHEIDLALEQLTHMKYQKPPSVVEFYHLAKNLEKPVIPKKVSPIAKKYLAEIRQKLDRVSHRT